MAKQLNRSNFPGPKFPEKILQFGEGNFLRAFIDWIIDNLNEKTNFNSGVTIVRPIDTHQPSINEQDGLYTTIIRGLNEQGKAIATPRIIYSVNREILVYQDYQLYLKCAENPDLEFIFSNTTEAGIAFSDKDKITDTPPATFPAKLTCFLHHRFQFFKGQKDKGLIIIPCELIDYNGDKLKELIIAYAKLWQLDDAFIEWINESNTFCSTLVDRIVTGYPKDESAQLEQQLGYQDRFLDTAEYFYLFVIQGPQWLKQKLKLDQVDLNILVVDDIKPYKERKVGILNGAHTAMVPVAYLAGLRTVGECMGNVQIETFVKNLLNQEVIPTLSLDKQQLIQFADEVLKRFKNPFIKHELMSISLNSLTKFKTRLLPQLLTYSQRFNQPPKYISFSLAALIAFYRGEYQGQAISLTDDAHLLERFKQWQPLYQNDVKTLVSNVLKMTDHWGQDLNNVVGLTDLVTENLKNILSDDIKNYIPNN
ncbi:tagaturonate reductase [Gilliamella sp. wkB112]|uniref:tagaturonate reductase n=1 Tax=Gilliamella sp. wkB112 TaxID=3120257 RepID=UPI00080E812D|nr:tagaturonate reductase [Gilliamella apicola]OCG01465.1 altronate oxidoreductase [Gilliamella apicola]